MDIETPARVPNRASANRDDPRRRPTARCGRSSPRGLRNGVVSILCALLAGVLGGCVLRSGPTLDTFPPVSSPQGIFSTLETTNGTIAGELIEVRAGGLLVAIEVRADTTLARPALTRIGWSAISAARFAAYPFNWRPGRSPEPDDLIRLSRVSRVPPGIPEGGMEALLEAFGQAEVEEISLHLHPVADDEAPLAPQEIEFLERARVAAERFRELEEALTSGYRPIGPDFPGMGTHWLNTSLLMAGGTNPDRPPILTYLETPAGPVFTGVAYGQIHLPGRMPGSVPFAGRWHDHAGSVDEENLSLGLGAGMAGQDEPRLSMLHLWVGVSNPDGVFAQNNWALPYLRGGWMVPSVPTEAAGKALYLATGGVSYYASLMEALQPLPEPERVAVERVLAAHAARVPEAASAGEVAELERLWHATWRELRAATRPETWEAIRFLGP